MPEDRLPQTQNTEQPQQLFDPTRVITNPQGRAIAEMYGVTDEQAAALKTKAAEVYIDMQKKQLSGEDFQQRLDNGLHAMASNAAQIASDGNAAHLTASYEDEVNKTKVWGCGHLFVLGRYPHVLSVIPRAKTTQGYFNPLVTIPH